MDASKAAQLGHTPDDSADVRVSTPSESAGGFPAILQTLHHIRTQTGLVRGTKGLLSINQPEGFDCPGCAWPEPGEHRAVAEFCENGAKALAWEATTRTIGSAFFAEHPISRLLTQSDYWLGQQGRLVEPLVRRPGSDRYEAISWEAALSLIADTLRALPPAERRRAVFYTSGRTSNEAAFLYQLLVRYYGTNNLPDCSDLCHESSGVALRESIGYGKGTVQLEDFALADAIFVIGQNPGTNHPRMLSTLQEAAQRGCAIVSVNPLAEAALSRFRHPQDPVDLLGEGTAISSLHLPVRIGGDAALFKGIMKELLAEEARRPGQVLDWEFLTANTSGFEVFREGLAAVGWDEILAESGLGRAQIRAAAEVVMNSRRLICCWAMGLTQHKEAVATIQEVINLLLLGGHLGRPGAGACPVRGHSNVQGDRTMGILERPDPAFRQRLGARFGFTVPAEPGLDTVGAIQAMLDGRVDVFCALGGNFLSATPDTERTAAALGRLKLSVQISTKLHRGHLITGETALILPCLSRSEIDVQAGGPQLVSVENSMSIVHASRGSLQPAARTLRSEIDIVCGLGAALFGPQTPVDWRGLAADYDRIRDHIEAVIPGFEHYNQRIRTRAGFLLPHPVRERKFSTETGRAQFLFQPLLRRPLAADELLMMTIRSHDQFNTTIYGLDDRYRGIASGRRVILMNEKDLARRGIAPQSLVDLTSRFRGEERVARRFVAVPYKIPEGCAATYFPETNVLIPLDSYADKSRTPTSKSVVITVAASGD